MLLLHAVTADCLQCICNKESFGCRPLGCRMDRGSYSCGYYQIKKNYYIDCGTPGRRGGEDLETAWKRCADDYSCASNCVRSYVNRYKYRCSSIGANSCQAMARLHNGGPSGCQRSSTLPYWNSIKACYGGN
ncbi:unnamed protein product [Heligmosomoides polygyrus]|uniref:lysozyme n=1 Tax=Heligmosomoides polygyrus TaxID=6339 RepID=A0A3P8DCU5_HELPZ|nr:unnamed protein product [Heligmosomoides polygyrus]